MCLLYQQVFKRAAETMTCLFVDLFTLQDVTSTYPVGMNQVDWSISHCYIFWGENLFPKCHHLYAELYIDVMKDPADFANGWLPRK